MLLALVVPSVIAAEDPNNPYISVHTKNFATPSYHESTQLVTNSKAGLGTGYGVFGILMLYAFVHVIYDEIERNKDIDKKLVDARAKMTSELYQIDVEEVDRKYYEALKAKGKKDEGERLIEEAAKKKKEETKKE